MRYWVQYVASRSALMVRLERVHSKRCMPFRIVVLAHSTEMRGTCEPYTRSICINLGTVNTNVNFSTIYTVNTTDEVQTHSWIGTWYSPRNKLLDDKIWMGEIAYVLQHITNPNFRSLPSITPEDSIQSGSPIVCPMCLTANYVKLIQAPCRSSHPDCPIGMR
jgi:hypothetical protein